MNKDNPTYSVVIPMYNEQDVIFETIRRVKLVMVSMEEPYELLFIDDGSEDSTCKTVKSYMKRDKSIRLISLSRNFGHQAAITAGIDYAFGDAVIIIDADLQDPPEVIPDMVALWKQGYEVVYGKRKSREGENWFKELSAKCFYRLLQSMTDIDIPVDTGDFRLIDRKVCNTLKSLDERNRYVRGLVSWVGFKHIACEYERGARLAGETKYPLRKMMRLAIDGVVGFSYKPLRLAGWFGGVMCLCSIIVFSFSFIMWIFGRVNTGWVFVLPIIFFSQGIMMIGIGFAGEYIGRLLDEAKRRPIYIVREESGEEGD